MEPNKFLTSGSPLQIPMSAVQRPPSATASSGAEGAMSLARHEPASEPADFSVENLSNQQVTVLRALANGKDILAAAQEAGVGRSTVYRWHHDPHFQKCLRAWQSHTKESGRNIMLTLIERSARIVERALDKDDVRVALTLLTKLGVLAASDGPPLSAVEVSAPARPDNVASPTPPNPQPKDPKKLHGMINELEARFGDMLPGGRSR